MASHLRPSLLVGFGGIEAIDAEFPYRVPIVDRGGDCRTPVCRPHFRFLDILGGETFLEKCRCNIFKQQREGLKIVQRPFGSCFRAFFAFFVSLDFSYWVNNFRGQVRSADVPPKHFSGKKKVYTIVETLLFFFSGSEALWCIPFFPDIWCIPFSLVFPGKWYTP